MAVTTEAIPAAELTARAADKPLAIFKSLLEIAYKLAAANLVTNTTGTLAAGDSSAAGYDRRTLTRRLLHHIWKGNAAALSWDICLDQGTTEEWVDALVIAGHNLDGVTVTVQADSTTPSGAWGAATTVFTFTQAGTDTVLRLHATTRYKARYWRIRLTKGSTFTPEASSIWLGKAIQFPEHPLLGSDPAESMVGEGVEVKTKGGIVYRYILHGAIMVRMIAFTLKQGLADTFFVALLDGIRAARGLNGGLANFWWCDEPTTGTTLAKMVHLEDPQFTPVLKRTSTVADDSHTSFQMTIREIGTGV